jgi:hypothetical protein
MNEAKTREEDLDPGAYIGQQPELASERLPEGPRPGDVRVAAHDSAPGVQGEPDAPSTDGGRTEFDRHELAGDARDAVEGEIGSARLREPTQVEREQPASIEPADRPANADS